MTHSRLQCLSTEAVTPAERFDYWSAILSSSLTPMSVESDHPSTFTASVGVAPMGALTVIEQDGSSHRSRRSQRDLERSEHHSPHLLVSLGSEGTLEHRGRLRLRRGELVLTDSRQEHRIELRSAYHFMHLKMSPPTL